MDTILNEDHEPFLENDEGMVVEYLVECDSNVKYLYILDPEEYDRTELEVFVAGKLASYLSNSPDVTFSVDWFKSMTPAPTTLPTQSPTVGEGPNLQSNESISTADFDDYDDSNDIANPITDGRRRAQFAIK